MGHDGGKKETELVSGHWETTGPVALNSMDSLKKRKKEKKKATSASRNRTIERSAHLKRLEHVQNPTLSKPRGKKAHRVSLALSGEKVARVRRL